MCRRVSLAHRVVLLGALFLSHGGAVRSSRRVEVPGVGDPTIRADEGRLLQNNTEDEKDAVELPSCNDVLLHESIDDRCHHALNCEGESLMTFRVPPSHPYMLANYLLPTAERVRPSTISPTGLHCRKLF